MKKHPRIQASRQALQKSKKLGQKCPYLSKTGLLAGFGVAHLMAKKQEKKREKNQREGEAPECGGAHAWSHTPPLPAHELCSAATHDGFIPPTSINTHR